MPDAFSPSKPLVLLESEPASLVLAQRLPEPDQALLAAGASGGHCEAAFRELLGAGNLAPALRFLTVALRRRVVVWWGYECLRAVRAAAAAHRAALAARGEPGTLGLMLPDAPQAPGMVMGFDTALPVSAQDFAPEPPVVGGKNLADPASWPPARLEADGTLRFLPPELEPLLAQPLREPSAGERFFLARKAHIESLAPAERSAWLARDARSAELHREVFGLSAGEVADRTLDRHLAATGRSGDDSPDSPHQRLKQAMDRKVAEMKTAMDGWKAKHAQAMLALPQQPPGDLSGDGPAARNALAAARAWILDPSREKGQAAIDLGRQCQGLEQAAGLLAMACHYNGTDLNPPGTPKEVPPVPPPPATAPSMVFAALELAKAIPDSGHTPDEWLAIFIEIGMEVAQGLRTWDVLLGEREQEERPWAGRAGFGRTHAKPDDPPTWAIRRQGPP